MSETPFRESTVPMSKYIEMEKNLKIEIERLNNSNENLRKNLSDTRDDFYEYKKKEVSKTFTSLVFYLIFFGLLTFGVFKGLKACNRNDPGGEAAILNAESSLRKHMRGMNNTVVALSCRVSSTNEINPNCSSSYKFCQISYRPNNSNTASNAYYCCDNAYAEYSNGCIEVKSGSDAGVASDASR